MPKPVGYYYDNNENEGPKRIGFHRVVNKLGDRVAVGIIADDGKESVRVISAKQILQPRQVPTPSESGVLQVPDSIESSGSEAEVL